ncbi:MAG: GAF domain-containing protein [Desulfobacteraceae bacterium]|nr:GAF domain-containing protein [Desulfobacteraceae bacterium]
MEKKLITYDTLLKITNGISASHDPEEVLLLTVNSIKTALGVKGCTLFLVNRKEHALEVAASVGLSNEYLEKGPISALRSIAESLDLGPVAIDDVMDDPRLQYPQAAKKEGIASILSVPICVHSRVIGALRVYTAEKWEFTMDEVNFVQAVALIAGMAIDFCRLNKGLKSSIEILKTLRDPSVLRTKRRTPYEGVPTYA